MTTATLAPARQVPAVFESKDCWFLIHTFVSDGAAHLEVYRSLQLRPEHRWLDAARQLLEKHPHVEITRETVPDRNMWLCQAERVVYRFERAA